MQILPRRDLIELLMAAIIVMMRKVGKMLPVNFHLQGFSFHIMTLSPSLNKMYEQISLLLWDTVAI